LTRALSHSCEAHDFQRNPKTSLRVPKCPRQNVRDTSVGTPRALMSPGLQGRVSFNGPNPDGLIRILQSGTNPATCSRIIEHARRRGPTRIRTRVTGPPRAFFVLTGGCELFSQHRDPGSKRGGCFQPRVLFRLTYDASESRAPRRLSSSSRSRPDRPGPCPLEHRTCSRASSA